MSAGLCQGGLHVSFKRRDQWGCLFAGVVGSDHDEVAVCLKRQHIVLFDNNEQKRHADVTVQFGDSLCCTCTL